MKFVKPVRDALLIVVLMGCEKNTVVQDPGDPIDHGEDLAVQDILVDGQHAFQVMDGIGANAYAFPYANDIHWSWNKTRFVFDEIDLHYVRLASWTQFEENNDNDDPYIMNDDGFDHSYHTFENHDVPFAKFLQSRNIAIDLGIWTPPAWLAKPVDGTDYARIDPDDYDELGEWVSAYVLKMKENDVDLEAVQVQNEPTHGVKVLYGDRDMQDQPAGPTALQKAARSIVDQLDHFGLSGINLYGPDNHSPDNMELWAGTWLADDVLKSRTSAVSYHTWWVNNFEAYDAIRAVAEENDMPVWATEVGYCALETGCFGETHFLRPETWGTAWDYALSHYRAIKWSHASRVYHWSVVGFDGCVSETGQRYPSFYILKHFANYIPPKARLVESEIDDDQLLTLVFKLEDQTYTAIIINHSSDRKKVRLKDGVKTLTVSEAKVSEDNKFDQDRSGIEDEAEIISQLVLPGNSITSAKLRR